MARRTSQSQILTCCASLQPTTLAETVSSAELVLHARRRRSGRDTHPQPRRVRAKCTTAAVVSADGYRDQKRAISECRLECHSIHE